MIISEKQIIELISIAHFYRNDLLHLKSLGNLSKAGELSLEYTCRMLTQIQDQQSEELKEIK